MEPMYYEVSSYFTGGGVETRYSLKPPDGQIIVVDYLYAMVFQKGDVGTVWQQINITSASGQPMRNLWFQRLDRGIEVITPGFAIAPRLRLQPGEYITLYQNVPSGSNGYLSVIYHFEPADVRPADEQQIIPATAAAPGRGWSAVPGVW